MDLFSIQFLSLLAVLLSIYYAVGRFARRGQWVVLLAGSLAFYAIVGDPRDMLVMGVVAVATWASGIALASLDDKMRAQRKATRDRAQKKEVKARFTRRKRTVLIGCFALCLLILGYFKYWNVILFQAGLASSPSSLKILLPLGISFYTFQSLGYLIASYNGAFPPQRNFLRYLLFVTYFPQIIQGPINRYDELSEQLYATRSFDIQVARRGLLRMGLGFLKVMAIANVLTGAVSSILDGATPTTPGSVLAYGILLYSLQIYASFSGGIDIVEGVSELFGIQMAQNFRQPYFSTSLSEFWRRWHMSLGVWMRNYVFYPLAITRPFKRLGKWGTTHLGRQVGRTLPACVANVIVFLLVGLWHGAEYHFLAWGLYYGVAIALSDLLAPCYERLANALRVDRTTVAYTCFAVARTFVLVQIGRFYDYINSVALATRCIGNVFLDFSPSAFLPTLQSLDLPIPEWLGAPPVTLCAIAVVLVVDLLNERGVDVRGALLARKLPIRVLVYLVVGVIVVVSFAYDQTTGGGRFAYANF